LADFNFKDVDRLRTFLNVAKENDRKLVVKLNDAYFLKYLSKDPNLNIPNFDSDNIIIYVPKMGTGMYQDSDYRFTDKQFLGRINSWNAQEIIKNERNVLCALGFYSFNVLIDMKPESGAAYIHSASEPYNEEMEISHGRINAWMDHFGLHKFQCHCSGHAKRKDLFQIISEINPCKLYPVHTTRPEVYKNISEHVIDINEGEKYSLT
jgi:ribonuclease J